MSRVQRILEKAQKLWEEGMASIKGLPDPAGIYSESGRFWYSSKYQEFREICHQRSKLGFADGVFHTLAAIGMDEKKAENKTFNHGDGI